MTRPTVTSPITAPRRTAPPARAPLPRPSRLAVGAAIAAGLLLAVSLAAFRLLRPGALPGVEVSGVELGGLRGAPLREAVARIAQDRAATEVTAVAETGRVTVGASELGYAVDTDATVRAVLERGRQSNPFAAIGDQLRAFGGTLVVQPVQRIDGVAVARWALSSSRKLSSPPSEGGVTFRGTTVVRVDARPGVRVPPEALDTAVSEALLGGSTASVSRTVTAPTEPAPPRATAGDLDALLAQARIAVSAPIRLVRDGQTLTISPRQIAAILHSAPGGRAEPPLRLVGEPAKVEELLRAGQRDRFDVEPVSARFTVSGGTVSLAESVPGFRFDPAATAAQIAALAVREREREGLLAGEVVAPALSTEQARALHITERVSTFTTSHACCQGRVRNIHRIADLVDDTLIRPGETFSLNRHVGPRTTAKGFVEGGAIQEGEFVDEIGGGVSQFTTTMFNAAYFGGYDIVEHQPHSYFISRYPEGREATLNYPGVDLKIRNNSPHGILVKTAYTDTSVTVSFWATKWVEVTSATGPRTDPTTAEEVYRHNDELPPGTEEVVQDGGTPGFTVTVTRTRRFPDGRRDRDVFRTTYKPEPRIVERNDVFE